jgi:hypothetical protein
MCLSFDNKQACTLRQNDWPDPERVQARGLENGWVEAGHAVVRVFVVKLSEFLNRWRAGELRADTDELNEVAVRWHLG